MNLRNLQAIKKTAFSIVRFIYGKLKLLKVRWHKKRNTDPAAPPRATAVNCCIMAG